MPEVMPHILEFAREPVHDHPEHFRIDLVGCEPGVSPWIAIGIGEEEVIPIRKEANCYIAVSACTERRRQPVSLLGGHLAISGSLKNQHRRFYSLRRRIWLVGKKELHPGILQRK